MESLSWVKPRTIALTLKAKIKAMGAEQQLKLSLEKEQEQQSICTLLQKLPDQPVAEEGVIENLRADIDLLKAAAQQYEQRLADSNRNLVEARHRLEQCQEEINFMKSEIGPYYIIAEFCFWVRLRYFQCGRRVVAANGKYIEVGRGSLIQEIITNGNDVCHRSNIKLDLAFYKIGEAAAWGTNGRYSKEWRQDFILHYHFTPEECCQMNSNNLLEILNMHASMVACHSWTTHTKSKSNDAVFKAAFDDCLRVYSGRSGSTAHKSEVFNHNYGEDKLRIMMQVVQDTTRINENLRHLRKNNSNTPRSTVGEKGSAKCNNVPQYKRELSDFQRTFSQQENGGWGWGSVKDSGSGEGWGSESVEGSESRGGGW